MIEHSESLNELAAALSKAQAEMKGALKDSVNPHFNAKYSGLDSVLEACRPALNAHGISVVQAPSASGSAVGMTTMLLHTSGQWIRSTLDLTARDASPQAIGSCITYARRYGVSSMAGVAPEDDDDGNAAQGDKSKNRGPYWQREREQRKETPEAPPATMSDRPAHIDADGVVEPPSAYEAMLARAKGWSPEAQAALPKDESEYHFADPAMDANRGEYTDAIKRVAAERRINASMLGDLKELFFGVRRVSLETTDGSGEKRPNPHLNIHELRALYLEMDTAR